MKDKEKANFIITGCRETGNYTFQKFDNGCYHLVHEVKDNKQSGLKESRKWIGDHIVSNGNSSLNVIVTHQCIKPGRDKNKNPIHHWELSKYF
ncbi:hypothetical protein QUF84_04035 [Fictibacillus enclensis]|uniref:hypothetical protein n=1 Tax=Fictibacillus enclensis TaxID=1017270 RepID=UPI0025A2DC1F|nr:hypothetical protein [Fictibacillus enclensis]MDM5336400.1 hypothetical protein [Fictibacillus enclensis]